MIETPAPTVVTQRLIRTVVSRAKVRELVTERIVRNVVSERPARSGRVSGVGGFLQGAPGPRQIYNQASAPAAIAGYTLLWLKSGVSADPNDRDLILVE